MPLQFEKGDVMEYLWSQLEKTPDGGHIVYTMDDVDSLWWMGFVDTEKHSLDAWRAVFEPYRQPDGNFLLSKGAFLALEAYRYTGEIMVPFDAMMINEGKYTDEGLQELFDLSVRPSCFVSSDEVMRFLEDLKRRYREPDGLIRIEKPAKLEIKKLIDEHPSPRRNLELILDRMLQEGVDTQLATELGADETARATTEAARQVSKFTSMPVSAAEVQSGRLKALERRKPARKARARAAAEKPSTELKRIRRSRKGVRG